MIPERGLSESAVDEISNMTRGVNVVSLRSAILCVDCEVISTSNGTRCHVCSSSAVLSLSRILGGPLKETAEWDYDQAPDLDAKVPRGVFAYFERGSPLQERDVYDLPQPKVI